MAETWMRTVFSDSTVIRLSCTSAGMRVSSSTRASHQNAKASGSRDASDVPEAVDRLQVLGPEVGGLGLHVGFNVILGVLIAHVLGEPADAELPWPRRLIA